MRSEDIACRAARAGSTASTLARVLTISTLRRSPSPRIANITARARVSIRLRLHFLLNRSKVNHTLRSNIKVSVEQRVSEYEDGGLTEAEGAAPGVALGSRATTARMEEMVNSDMTKKVQMGGRAQATINRPASTYTPQRSRQAWRKPDLYALSHAHRRSLVAVKALTFRTHSRAANRCPQPTLRVRSTRTSSRPRAGPCHAALHRTAPRYQTPDSTH